MNDATAARTSSAVTSSKPNLAVLASQAAIALHRKAKGKDAQLNTVILLGELLRGTVDTPSVNAAKLLDPLTADLLSRAFADSHLDSLPQLREKATQVIDQLLNVQGEARTEVLTTLSDFCLALSRGAQAEYLAAWMVLPPHPFRR